MLTNSNNFIQTFEMHVKNIEKRPKNRDTKKILNSKPIQRKKVVKRQKTTNMQEYISRNPDSSILTRVCKILEISLEISLAIPFQNVLFFDLFCRSFNFMKICIAPIKVSFFFECSTMQLIPPKKFNI